MISVDIITGRRDIPRQSRRTVCLAGSLGSNSTDRAGADRSRSTSHIDICWRSRRRDYRALPGHERHKQPTTSRLAPDYDNGIGRRPSQ